MTKWTIADMPDQQNRVALVTGANSGIGYEIALALARKGARVILACRNMDKGQAALERIAAQVTNADLDLRRLDLNSLALVHTFADGVCDDYVKIDLLINNAGLMAIPRRESVDGYEMQFAVNHLGHFALTGLLLPLLLGGQESRVVTVSSMVAFFGRIDFDDLQGEQHYTRYGAYSQSKLANILFAFELQRRLKRAGAGMLSLAAHPGYSATNLQAASVENSGSGLEAVAYGVLNRVLAQSSAMGALPELFAATAGDVRAGALYGPSFFNFRGYPEEVVPPQAALNDDDAEQLWDVSEELSGVTFRFDSA